MSKLTIWHNPRCSKSREALNLLEESGKEFEIVKYLDENPSRETLEAVLKKMSLRPREIMRTKEAIYKELDLKNEDDDTKLIEAMLTNPKLIERPIIIKDDSAIIARPPSLTTEFI